MMMKIKIKYLLILILIISKSESLFSQDTLYNLWPNIVLIDFKPNLQIKEKKIKVVSEYYHWDSIYHNDTSYLVSKIKYNNGRIIEKIEYNSDYQSTQIKTITNINWISDSIALARVIYNQYYNDGELISYKDYCLSKKDSGKTFFHDIRIEFDKNYVAKPCTYLNHLGKPCTVYMTKLSSFDGIKNKKESIDTIFENNRIKKLTYSAILDSQTINGYHQDAYTIKNTFEYIYDSIGRVTDKFIVNSQSNKYFDTLRTKIIYYDSNKVKSVICNDGSYYGFYKGNLDFIYNNKGQLVGMINDKNPYDSLIDEEYIYNKNETIRKWLFFPASYDHRVTTIEEYTKNGLIQYTKYYSNKKYNGTYIIYKYSKKNKNFKNKIILKSPN